MKEQIIELLVPTVMGLISIVLSWVGASAKNYFNDLEFSKEIRNNKYLAILAVEAVEGMYKHEESKKKFDKAKNIFLSSLGKKGIDMSPEELQGYIESALFELQQGWNNEEVLTSDTTEKSEDI